MQQRQPRLGDILDDYCPRERRLTNHAVVAMIGDQVKQTRCTTCEAEHEYKHARLPRQRRKPEESALYSQVLANVSPKKPASTSDLNSAHEAPVFEPDPIATEPPVTAGAAMTNAPAEEAAFDLVSGDDPHAPDEEFTEDDSDVEEDGFEKTGVEEGPAHRRLIRAQLPRHEGQVSTTRQAPDFTIRQPNNPRGARFRARPQRGGPQFQGSRGAAPGNGNGNGAPRGGGQRPGGRPNGPGPRNDHQGPGRNRSK